MALLWFDGFHHYNTVGSAIGNEMNKEDVYSILSTARYFARISPDTGFPALGSHTSNFSGVSYLFPGGSRTSGSFGVGGHFLFGGVTMSSEEEVVSFLSGTARRYTINFNSTGNLVIRSGSRTGSIIAISPNTFDVNTTYHLEIKVTQHASAGSIEVRVGGTTLMSATGINTSTTIDRILFFMRSNFTFGSEHLLSNLYIWDDTGSENNDWLGEKIVYTLMPVADGPQTDWVPSTGTDGYAILDDIPPGSEYLEAESVGDVSSFEFETLPSSDISITAIRTAVHLSKTGTTDTGVSIAVEGVKGETHHAAQGEYSYASDLWITNPSTDEPWSPVEVNGLEVALERES